MLKNLDTIVKRNNKPFFLKGDVAVYLAVLFIVVCLFLSFVILPTSGNAKGFSVTVDRQTIFTFEFSKDKVEVAIGMDSLVETTKVDGGYLVTVYTDSAKHDYNVIFIDVVNKSAVMTESTCSISKDCTLTPAISSSGGIYCAPHRLKITALSDKGFSDPVVG